MGRGSGAPGKLFLFYYFFFSTVVDDLVFAGRARLSFGHTVQACIVAFLGVVEEPEVAGGRRGRKMLQSVVCWFLGTSRLSPGCSGGATTFVNTYMRRLVQGENVSKACHFFLRYIRACVVSCYTTLPVSKLNDPPPPPLHHLPSSLGFCHVLLACLSVWCAFCDKTQSNLRAKWSARLQWVPEDVDIWRGILAVRSLVLTPRQVRPLYISSQKVVTHYYHTVVIWVRVTVRVVLEFSGVFCTPR